MDNIIQLGDSDRAHILFHSLGCSYLCLWLHVPPQNYLQCKYGYYPEELREQHQLSSSSYGSLARRLFDQYCMQTIFLGEHNESNTAVPGLAFKRPSPCIILREIQLQQFASSDVQNQFYRESRIKTAVFMGCRSGEIELGFSNDPQINLEMELRKVFPDDFPSMDLPPLQIPTSLQDPQQQSRPSSSSSRSLDSVEYPSYPFNLSTMREGQLMTNQPSTSSIHQSFIPTPESINSAMANAILAAITNPVSPSATPPWPPRDENLVPQDRFRRRGAFTSCRAMAPKMGQAFQAASPLFRRQTMMKKVLSFYRGLNIRRLQLHQAARESGAALSRPTTSKLHHVILERKRREKINDSFQALRTLLPPGTKKDKATVLRTTKEYMSSLQDQISELHRKNQLLDSQLSSLGAKIDKYDLDTISSGRSSPNANERVHVQLTPVMESSSFGERRMDLRVSVRGDGRSSMIDLITQLLGFLKEVREVQLASMEAQTIMAPPSREEHQAQQQQQQQHSINRVTMRLVIEGNEWDQSAFLEAIRRVIAELSR